jgi:hypothetical protein
MINFAVQYHQFIIIIIIIIIIILFGYVLKSFLIQYHD